MERFIIVTVFMSLVLTVLATTDIELWSDFKKKFNRVYTNDEEEGQRFEIFRNNLKQIEEHNAKYQKGETTYYMGINKFSDWTPEELNRLRGTKPKKHNRKLLNKRRTLIKRELKRDITKSLPDAIDWRTDGYVRDVIDQGICQGAGYAIGLVGSLESILFLQKSKKFELSPQCILDCASDIYGGNLYCDGVGIDSRAGFNYISTQGIALEKDYPYLGRRSNGTCMMNESLRADVTIRDYIDVLPLEKYLQDALVNIGPIFVEINNDELLSYKGGIYTGVCDNENTNTGMLLVGYGNENGAGYWIVRSSFGTSWGEDGYLRLGMNGHDGICGIASNAVYPWII